MKIPVISVAILAGQAALANVAGATMLEKLDAFQSLYTGIDITTSSFRPERLIPGWGPWLAKRFLLPIARPRVPFGLPISLS